LPLLYLVLPTNSGAEESSGWKLLSMAKPPMVAQFQKDFFPRSRWVVEDGWLQCLGNGAADIITDAQFDDFELEWE